MSHVSAPSRCRPEAFAASASLLSRAGMALPTWRDDAEIAGFLGMSGNTGHEIGGIEPRWPPLNDGNDCADYLRVIAALRGPAGPARSVRSFPSFDTETALLRQRIKGAGTGARLRRTFALPVAAGLSTLFWLALTSGLTLT